MNTAAKMRETLQHVRDFITMDGYQPKTLKELFDYSDRIIDEVNETLALPKTNFERFDGVDEGAAKAFAEEELNPLNKDPVEPYIDDWTSGQCEGFAYWLFNKVKEEEVK